MNIIQQRNSANRSGFSSRKRQAGVSLVELMIGLALSVIVTSSMVILMGNSMGTATRIIQSSQLSDELRNAMSMMTRDLRRANYSANSIFCYGNASCGDSGAIAEQLGDVDVDGDCFWFALDRDSNGNAADDPVGGFRRVEVGADDIGVIEMWTGDSAPNCNAAQGANGWIQLTDPSVVNVEFLTIDDTDSFTVDVEQDEVVLFTNRQRLVSLTMQGNLVLEQNAGIDMVSRTVRDIVMVRNDYIVP